MAFNINDVLRLKEQLAEEQRAKEDVADLEKELDRLRWNECRHDFPMDHDGRKTCGVCGLVQYITTKPYSYYIDEVWSD